MRRQTRTAAEAGAAAARFSAPERRFLLQQPLIGAGVIDQLERVGFSAIAQIEQAGASAVVEIVCDEVGSRAWRNRRRALEGAIHCWRDVSPAAGSAGGGGAR